MDRVGRRGPQKKLTEAARHLAGGETKNEAEDDLLAFGVSEEAAREFAPPDPVHFEVWPENWDTIQVFEVCETQWNWAVGMTAVRTGLDYTALRSAMGMMGIPRKQRREVFHGVRLMELETLSVQAEKAKR